MFKSADGSLKAEVVKEDPDQKIRIWLWSTVESTWKHALDVPGVDELKWFVDLDRLDELSQ